MKSDRASVKVKTKTVNLVIITYRHYHLTVIVIYRHYHLSLSFIVAIVICYAFVVAKMMMTKATSSLPLSLSLSLSSSFCFCCWKIVSIFHNFVINQWPFPFQFTATKQLCPIERKTNTMIHEYFFPRAYGPSVFRAEIVSSQVCETNHYSLVEIVLRISDTPTASRSRLID